MSIILELEAPGLSAKLQALTPERRRAVIAAAYTLVAESMKGLQSSTRQILGTIAIHGELSAQDLAITRRLAEEVDDQYFSLQDTDEGEAALFRFREARLLTAISQGFGNASSSDVEDAIYELSRACDDPTIVFDVVRELTNG